MVYFNYLCIILIIRAVNQYFNELNHLVVFVTKYPFEYFTLLSRWTRTNLLSYNSIFKNF